jgi:hypothetical protein
VHPRRAIALGSIVALVIAAFGAAPVPAAKPTVTAYASCATKKPFVPATHCQFDRPEHARATFVFRSNVGKRAVKVCQKILGLSFDGQQCLKEKQPIAYRAIPFELKGASKSFKVVVTFYVKAPGSGGPYKKAARVALRVGP